MTDKRKDAAWTSTSRRRFLQSAAWTAGAVATGVGSWIIRPDWANAAAEPIKVGIATDLTGAIGYAGNANANVAKIPQGVCWHLFGRAAPLPYADVCENNELRTYCISIKPLSISGR
jgi:hypothetical protein